MKKVLLTVLAGMLAGTMFVPARAEDDPEKKIEFNGMVRARYEFLDNYLDLLDNDGSGDPQDDQIAFTPYRVMLGMTGYFGKNVSAHADIQYLGAFGDQLSPLWGFNNPPDQALDAYTNLIFIAPTNGVNLYTGWMEVAKIGGSDFGARLGRQEHTYGTELFIGDNNYYGGLSFDGLRGMWQRGHSDLNLFYYKLAELNSGILGTLPGTAGGANDSDFFGATYDWKFDKWGTVGGYVLFGQDMAGFGPVFNSDSSIVTYGARWNRPMMTGDNLNMFDWDVEVALQSGDIGDPSAPNPSIDISSYIGEAWFAFNYQAGDTHGRVHIGTLITSGDDPNTPDKDDSFFNYFGDFHAYNRFGDLDWVDLFGQQNITDFNIGYEHWFGDRHYVMAAFHTFTATELQVPGASDDLGDEIDLTYNFYYSKNLYFQVTAGQANPGDGAFALSPIYTLGNDDPVQRITLMAWLTW
jgi:hypothetical protein